MRNDLILGTAGHIDHGKTALIKALTGIDCDRLPEEKARGITIDIGFATLDLGEFRLGIVDVPGHERFIKNMLAGATGINLALLVIAADDSIMPQTREHLEILRLLGLKDGLIDDPRKCEFNPARDVPACSAGADASADCLSARQADAIAKVYSGPVSNGKPFFPGFMPGSEAVMPTFGGGTGSGWMNVILAAGPNAKPADFNLAEGTAVVAK